LAAKVSRTKTPVDDAGKNLVAGVKERVKAIDAERKRFRDAMDALRDQARKPLTEWEEEGARIQVELRDIRHKIADANERAIAADSATLRADLEMLRAIQFGERLGEPGVDLMVSRDQVAASIVLALPAREKQERDAAELERLRLEEAERKMKAEQAEQDERRARELAERMMAEKEYEHQGNAELDETRARMMAVEEEKAKQKAAMLAADERHRARVMSEAVDALVSAGLSQIAATLAVQAIADEEVPGVSIQL
jgi:hypothetical protein